MGHQALGWASVRQILTETPSAWLPGALPSHTTPGGHWVKTSCIHRSQAPGAACRESSSSHLLQYFINQTSKLHLSTQAPNNQQSACATFIVARKCCYLAPIPHNLLSGLLLRSPNCPPPPISVTCNQGRFLQHIHSCIYSINKNFIFGQKSLPP